MQNEIGKIITKTAEKTQNINSKVAGDTDYRNDDGLLICGKCHTPRECRVKTFGIVPCVCECARAIFEAEKADMYAEQRRLKIKDLMRKGITDPSYIGHTFANDDLSNPAATEICKKYCDHWIDMWRENIGMLIYGGVGTGKTFLACCMASELLAHCVPVCVTNLTTLIRKTSGFNSYDMIDRLAEFDLLIIDDLGVERETSYSLEQAYAIIDARYRTGLPLIITTNLSPADLKNPDSMEKKRIYDRVGEMCAIPVKINGTPRRRDIAAEKREKAMRILDIRGTGT